MIKITELKNGGDFDTLKFRIGGIVVTIDNLEDETVFDIDHHGFMNVRKEITFNKLKGLNIKNPVITIK